MYRLSVVRLKKDSGLVFHVVAECEKTGLIYYIDPNKKEKPGYVHTRIPKSASKAWLELLKENNAQFFPIASGIARKTAVGILGAVYYDEYHACGNPPSDIDLFMKTCETILENGGKIKPETLKLYQKCGNLKSDPQSPLLSVEVEALPEEWQMAI